MTGVSWARFSNDAAGHADIGRRLLFRPDSGEVALLATVRDRQPALAPVCPVFTSDGLYLLLSRGTPKHLHLLENPRYALHAQVGADDLEFRISGLVRFVRDPAERTDVLNGVTFEQFDGSDPIVELLIESALIVTWEDSGPVKESWHAPT